MTRLVLAAIATATLGCGATPDEFGAEGRARSGDLAFDCGALAYTLEMTCKDGDPPEPVYDDSASGTFPLARPFEVTKDMPCDLDPRQDPTGGVAVRASLDASCTATTSEGAMDAAVALAAHGEHVCAPGDRGSAAYVRTSWRGLVVLPDEGLHKIDVRSSASVVIGTCHVELDGRALQSIPAGDALIGSAFVRGVRSIDVALVCNDDEPGNIVRSGCFGFGNDLDPATSPPSFDVSLRLSFHAARCPEACG